MPCKTPEEIDAVLPQTQCGLCGYGGCMPYAEALHHENAPINLCPPGGTKTLLALADLLQQDASPYLTAMQQKEKPQVVAVINESECIGCKKCIQVCPVDAILGGAKQMHTVLADECTGCELCIPPCPVDCIDLMPIEIEIDKSAQFRKRHEARTTRLRNEQIEKKLQKTALEKRQAYVQAALLRVKKKKLV